jgi:hypothetical protein
MNETTKNETFFPLKYWFELFGSAICQQIIYLTLIPVFLIGSGLNIFTIIILRGNQFKLPVFYYLKVYCAKSAIICLLVSTVFLYDTREILAFTNNKWITIYLSNIYIPFVNLLFCYQATLDILLTFDRLTSFSTRFQFYKGLKPRSVCVILFFVSFIVCIPLWFQFSHNAQEIKLNETTTFTFHYTDISKKIPSSLYYSINFIIDATAILTQLPLNIWTMILLKGYMKGEFISGLLHHALILMGSYYKKRIDPKRWKSK